jgi:hypothetical protein
MKNLVGICALLVISLGMTAGCSGGGESTQADIDESAKQLRDASKGVEPQPETGVAQYNGGGGGAPTTAPKPHR